MSSRVIKDCISNHPWVAVLGEQAQDQLLRWILLADDWGCFNADLSAIKAGCYINRKFTLKQIENIRQEFYDQGFLFCWRSGVIVWGYWTWWETGEFCGVRSFNKEGDRERNRRKTPAPPKEFYDQYIETHPQSVRLLDTSGDIRGQVGTVGAVPRSLFPFPVSPNLPSGDIPPQPLGVGSTEKKPHGEFGYACLTDVEHAKLKAKLNGHTADYIDRFDRWVAEAPDAKVGRTKVRRRERNAYPSILTWFHDDLTSGKLQQTRGGEQVFVPTN